MGVWRRPEKTSGSWPADGIWPPSGSMASGSAAWTAISSGAPRPRLRRNYPAVLGPVDVILVGVKAWQVPDAADAMRPLLGERTFVVPLQNGIEAPEQLVAEIGEKRVLGGLCRVLAFVEGPGHIRHAGVTPYVAFGELDGSRTARAETLREAFQRTRGVSAEVPADIGVAVRRDTDVRRAPPRSRRGSAGMPRGASRCAVREPSRPPKAT